MTLTAKELEIARAAFVYAWRTRLKGEGGYLQKMEDAWSQYAATLGDDDTERKYACAECGKLRTKDEGGSVFTVCDDCWDKKHPDATREGRKTAS